MAFNFYKEFTQRNYEPPKIQITDLQEGADSLQIGYMKSYIGFIKDIQVFKISADSIHDPDINQSSGLSNMFPMGYNENKTVNFMFLTKNNANYMPFKRDLLITKYTLAKTNSDSFVPQEGLYKFHDMKFSISNNIYTVIESDSNLDGYLSEKDSKSLY